MCTDGLCPWDKRSSFKASCVMVIYKMLKAYILSGIKFTQAGELIAVLRAGILDSRFNMNIYY